MNISSTEFVTKIRNKEHLPSGLVVSGDVFQWRCTSLKSLPDNLKVHGYLSLWQCTSLKSLPYKIRVGDTIYCDKELIDTIPKENLPLYINFKFKDSVHEHFTHRIRN